MSQFGVRDKYYRRTGLLGIYDGLVISVTTALEGWFTGLAARFAFASVIAVYYLNSAWSGMNGSLIGLFNVGDGTYAAALPARMEEVVYDPSMLTTFEHLFVHAGVWAEFFLPILIIVGLFTRIAAVGMIVVVIVQSWVDVFGHGLEGKSIGAMFDRLPDAIIFDQRLLWVFLLGILALHGAGKVSLDYVLKHRK
ncbi:MAG: DoxX family protein [Ahrensia sp.]|nr:DoxX family protein [Ahrensia sp.]